VPTFNQPRSTFADRAERAAGPDPDQPDGSVSPALLGETLIERAKTVVVVAQRVDEDRAAQILLDAASRADIPVRLAADQVMSALEADDDHDGITQDTLMHALGCVHHVEQPPDQSPLPTGPTGRPSGRAA
jgi:hypothetical protein